MKTKLVLFLFAILTATTPVKADGYKFHVVDRVAFYQVTETQKTPFWCWAATIAMALNAQGVHWRQEDVVFATKGRLSNETATAGEMSSFLNSWNHLDYNGQPWAVRSTRYLGMAPIPKILSALEGGRPLIATHKSSLTSEHAVIVYGAYMRYEGIPSLQLIYYFDPWTGKKGVWTGKEFLANTTNTWDVGVFR